MTIPTREGLVEELLREAYERDGSGAVVLECEAPDDVWALYNLVSAGDRVKGTTSRKVRKESASGLVATELKKITLEVSVKVIEVLLLCASFMLRCTTPVDIHKAGENLREFFAGFCLAFIQKTDYEGDVDVLRVSGPVAEENPFVQVGAYHTLEITLRSKLTLHKENWDRIHVDAIHKAVDPHQRAELQVVLIESGLCQIFLVSSSLAKRVAKVQVNIPKQRGPNSNYDKAKKRFYNDVFASLVLHTNFDAVKCVLVAGPGFTKDEFVQFVHAEATRRDCRSFISNRKMFVVASTSTAQRHALVELLSDPSIVARLDNAKAYRHAKRLQEFYRLFNATLTGGETVSNSLTCYGPKEVGLAVDAGAVKTLLITDGLLRSSCGAQRKAFVRITEEVEKAGGEVLIFSDQHSSGEQLNMLSGIAAILMFPMENDTFDDDKELA